MQLLCYWNTAKTCSSNTKNVEISTPRKCYKNAKDMQNGIIAIKCFNACVITKRLNAGGL